MRSLTALVLALFVSSCSGCGHVGFSTERLFKKLYLSTVVVTIDTATSSGHGSGVVIDVNDDRSLVLTCAHVVEEAAGKLGEIKVVFDVGETEHSYPALVVSMDTDKDLALLTVPAMDELRPIKVARKEPPLYTEVYIMGAPLGYESTASVALLTHKSRDQKPRTVWQLSSGVVIPGASGGPVVNDGGELVCIANSFAAHSMPLGVRLLPPPASPMQGRVNFPFTQVGFCVPLPTIKIFLKPYVQ